MLLEVFPVLIFLESKVTSKSAVSLGAKRSFEREFILEVLSMNQWSVANAAQALGVERTYLYRKLKVLSISLPV